MIQMDGRDRLRVTLLDSMSMVETNRSSVTGLTLEAILRADKNGTSTQPPARNQPKRTLLDVMQGEHRVHHRRDKTAWKALRGKLRLKRNANVWLAEERALSAREEETPEEIQTARMSLMELLDENEGQMGLVSFEGDDEDERVIGGGVEAMEINCCVCMVRSKGAAFIPCGHTFCRLCSTQLWLQRPNCPLCNTSILDILHLF